MRRSKFIKVLAGIVLVPSAIMAISTTPNVITATCGGEGFSLEEMRLFKKFIHGVK